MHHAIAPTLATTSQQQPWRACSTWCAAPGTGATTTVRRPPSARMLRAFPF